MEIKGFNISKEAVAGFAKGAVVCVGEALLVQGVSSLVTKGCHSVYNKMVQRKIEEESAGDQTVVIIKKEKENVKKQPLTVEEFRQRFKKAEGL